MKKETNNLRDILLSMFIILCFVALCPLSIYRGYKAAKNKYEIQEKDTVIIYKDYKITDAKWDRFTKALIWIESRGDSLAVGSKNDVGVLQITPILIEDANRILGYEAYTLEDRKNRIKSIEIFNVIQDHYNPTHDLHLALKVWNSRAPISYHENVIKQMNNFK